MPDKIGRFRIRFDFQLNITKPDEEWLAGQIEILKAQRKYVTFIRDGLRLMIDLSQGKTNVLFELFPWLQEKIESEKYIDHPLQPVPVPDAIAVKLERLETILLQQNMQPIQMNSAQPKSPHPTKSSIEKDSDIQLEVKTASTDEDNRPNWNFLISSAMNVYGNCNNLPDEVIKYGLRTQRIPASAVTKSLMIEEKGPKKMDVPQFEAPVFDDFF